VPNIKNARLIELTQLRGVVLIGKRGLKIARLSAILTPWNQENAD
jgi:hypothetical protein